MDGFKGAAEDEEGLKAQGRTQLTRPAAFFRNILRPVVDRVRTRAAVFLVALAWHGDALRFRAQPLCFALHSPRRRTAVLTN